MDGIVCVSRDKNKKKGTPVRPLLALRVLYAWVRTLSLASCTLVPSPMQHQRGCLHSVAARNGDDAPLLERGLLERGCQQVVPHGMRSATVDSNSTRNTGQASMLCCVCNGSFAAA